MIQGLPQKLKELRAKAGFSQRQVAKHVGVSASLISSYETGERTPSTENLLALSYLYRCSADFLLGRTAISQQHLLNTEGLRPKQVQLLRELIETMREDMS